MESEFARFNVDRKLERAQDLFKKMRISSDMRGKAI
jgi:hypothetical protein